MQVRNRRTNEVVDLPDEYDDDQIIQHFSSQQTPSLAQSFVGSAQQQLGPQLAQTLMQGPQRSTLPNIGGGAVVGLTPQQAQFTLQSAQNANVDSMANKMRQQQMVQQSIENEADRAQTLKLRQQELKNLVQAKKLEAEADKFEAELRAQDRQLDRESRAQLEAMRQEAANKRSEGRMYNLAPGGMLTDAQGNKIAENPKPAEEQNQIKWQLDTIQMVNSETGEVEDVRAYVAPGQAPQVIGPAPKGNQRNNEITPYQKSQIAADYASKVMRAQTEQVMKSSDPNYRTWDQLIKEGMDYANQFSGAAATPPPRSREELDAEVANWINKGYMSYVEDGEVVVVTPDGRAP